ncbi:hypothetical protein Tco_0531891 [Tanacetum coccineum]
MLSSPFRRSPAANNSSDTLVDQCLKLASGDQVVVVGSGDWGEFTVLGELRDCLVLVVLYCTVATVITQFKNCYWPPLVALALQDL